MSWNFDNDRPIYAQLLERLQMQIVSGRYSPGDKLPSVRELAAAVNVNPNTMQKAFAELERSGLITTQRTSGRYVTEDTQMIRQVQKDLACGHIRQFIQKMKELGFSLEEIKALIENQTAFASQNKEENPLLLHEQSHFASQNKEDLYVHNIDAVSKNGRKQKAVRTGQKGSGKKSAGSGGKNSAGAGRRSSI